MSDCRRVRMYPEVTPMMPSSKLLVKVERDLEKGKRLLVLVAATSLLSQMPQMVSGKRYNHVHVTSNDGLHPTQLGPRRAFCETEPSYPVIRTGMRDTHHSLDGHNCTTGVLHDFSIKESGKEE